MDFKNIHPQNSYRAFTPPPTPKRQWKKKLAFLVFLAAVFYVLFVYVLPNVEVTVFLSAENFDKEYDITLDQNVTGEVSTGNVFPAKFYQVLGEEQGSFKATGQKNTGDKAGGNVVFYNFTGRSQPVTKEMELKHSSGQVYFLKNELTIPAAQISDLGEIVAGKVTGEIEAKEAGEIYNQKSGRVAIAIVANEIQDKIYGETEDLSGGTSKITQVVSQEDLDNAQIDLSNRLSPKLKDKVKNQIKKDSEIMRNELTVLEINNVDKSTEINKEVSDFEMKINATLKALVYDEVALKKYLKAKSIVDLPDNKMVAEDDLGQLEITVKEMDLALGVVKIKIKAQYKVLPKTDVNSIKDSIKGLKEQDARRYILGLANVRDVRFAFTYNLLDKIPNNPNKIKIKVGN
ncbi:MAG TPA: hypothetical protein PLH37_00120 [bacterium]|nr:hypothetical protein [bacterium]